MHAHKQFVDRSSASVQLSDSFVNLDSCVEDGFFFFFGVWISRIGPLFSLSQLASDLTSTPTMSGSSWHQWSIPLTTAPRNHVEHSFCKARQLWTLSKLPSPCDYFEKRRKEHQDKVFQHAIDSHGQSASSSLISLHFAAGSVGIGNDAASLLATESNGTVLITRVMTSTAGHYILCGARLLAWQINNRLWSTFAERAKNERESILGILSARQTFEVGWKFIHSSKLMINGLMNLPQGEQYTVPVSDNHSHLTRQPSERASSFSVS